MNLLPYSQKSTLFRKVSRSLLVLFVLGLLVLPQGLFAASPPNLPSPTLVWPQDQDQTIMEKPVIRGLTRNNTRVEVFIDGRLNGEATVKEGKQGTASFSYTPFLPLESGKYTITVRACDNDSQAKSELTDPSVFLVEENYPAPTLFQPVVNKKTVSTRPLIVGIALNDSLIKVFIDGKLDGQFRVQNKISGVANFAYQPFLDLDPQKKHLVYATATNLKGKESAYSNVIGFLVKPQEVVKAEENPQVLGVTDVQAAATESAGEEEESLKEEKGTEEEVIASTEEEATKENEEATSEDESEQERSTLIWWIILIIIIIIVIVNLRGRGKKETSGGLKGLAELGKKEGEPSKKSDSESKSEQQTLLKKEESGEKEGDEKNMPPPPPSK